ncbi:hypothetical protein AV656_08280 [Bhargavaea cecembensis]|uniref:Uncharacterized protein n=1 Tax=Bhargavaea cecembensis TaxID=394098 RepID=A0A163FL33_9BACL|nr:polysialyltransferase family glycosyltransferase [Bhargavaea cecembensis]KZE38887.1 hypothetical protein AV656_08280 [Bhargavaea cecembensis]
MDNDYVTRHEIEDAIIRNEFGEIDFYAYCITPWHAIGVRAYINSMLKRNNSLRGVILISHNPGTDYLIDSDVFLFDLDVDVKIFKCKDSRRANKAQYFFKLIKSMQKVQPPRDNERLLHILRPFRPDIRFAVDYQQNTRRECKLVCLDEGVGTYKTDYEILKEKIRGSITTGSIHFLMSSFYKFLLLRNRLVPEYYTLFKDNKGLLEINLNIAKEYKKCIRQSVVSSINIETPKYALLLTQPFEIEQDVSSKNEINDIFDHLLKLFKQLGYEIIVKPHPREGKDVIDEYKQRGFKVLETKLPLEIYMESLKKKPEVVIGAVSTSLITANALNEVPAISVVYMNSEKLDRGYLKTADTFRERYGKFIHFPKSDFEIMNLINTLRKE